MIDVLGMEKRRRRYTKSHIVQQALDRNDSLLVARQHGGSQPVFLWRKQYQEKSLPWLPENSRYPALNCCRHGSG